MAVGRVCVNEEVLKRESFLQSAFACKLDLRESTLATLISVLCWTWLLDLIWKPLSHPRVPTGSRSRLEIRKKGPRKGSSFGKCKNLIVLCKVGELEGGTIAGICYSSASDLLALASETTQ